jgi:predicted NACHT family NTPase
MAGFDFDSPPADSAEVNLSAECERQLLPLVRGIVEAAVAAGWSREDVLLAMVELSWDLYEKRRGDLSSPA